MGRKRFFVVDTEGWLSGLWVDTADTHEHDGGRVVVQQAHEAHPRLCHLWVDAGFGGTFAEWVRVTFGWTVEVVTKVAGQTGFHVQPRRWVVERTFAWVFKQRRLTKDYEELEESSEAWIYLTMIGLMARRIAKMAT